MDRKLADSIMRLYKNITGKQNATFTTICNDFKDMNLFHEPDSNVVNPLLGEVLKIIHDMYIDNDEILVWPEERKISDYDNGWNNALNKLKEKILSISA